MITVLEVDYENPWIYEGRPFTSDDIGDYYGFVYRITNTNTGRNTLEENTSCRRENQKEEREESQANQTGKDIMEASDDLKRDIREIGKDSFRREILSLHTTLGKVNYEETKQLFLHNVLMESLDDGTPMYYNSNILGRYMRKDYGQFK